MYHREGHCNLKINICFNKTLAFQMNHPNQWSLEKMPWRHKIRSKYKVHYYDYESKHRKIQIQFTFENKNKIHNLVEWLLVSEIAPCLSAHALRAAQPDYSWRLPDELTPATVEVCDLPTVRNTLNRTFVLFPGTPAMACNKIYVCR